MEDHPPQLQNQFLISNGISARSHDPSMDIELITVQPTCYTSLRDVMAVEGDALPAPESPAGDVPIRNPLVKQAALAYLQPKSTPAEVDGGKWPERLRVNLDRCFAGGGEEVGCVGLLNGVVPVPIKEGFWKVFCVLSTTERRGIHED